MRGDPASPAVTMPLIVALPGEAVVGSQRVRAVVARTPGRLRSRREDHDMAVSGPSEDGCAAAIPRAASDGPLPLPIYVVATESGTWIMRMAARKARKGGGHWLGRAWLAGFAALAAVLPMGATALAAAPAPRRRRPAPPTSTRPRCRRRRSPPPSNSGAARLNGLNLDATWLPEWDPALRSDLEISMADRAGARWVRMGVSWNALEASGPGAYQRPGTTESRVYDQLLRAVNGARANGMRVLLFVDSTPAWANGTGSYDGDLPPSPPTTATTRPCSPASAPPWATGSTPGRSGTSPTWPASGAPPTRSRTRPW